MTDPAADILKTALDFEGHGARFYRDSAARARDPVVASVLLALAADEEAHAGLIRRFYEAVERRRGWSASTQDLPPPLPARERLEGILGETAASIGLDATFQSVYERAREIELQSRDFYRAQADASADSTLVKFFRFLTTVEQTHIDVLDQLLAATRHPGARESPR